MIDIQHDTTSSPIFTWRGTTCAHAPASARPFFVYLLHFERPYKHAAHYVGSSGTLSERMHAHRAGTGARLMEVIRAEGIGFTIARLWRCETLQEAHQIERRLKRENHSPRRCPICNPRHVQPCPLASLLEGHWPLFLFTEHQGKRRPMHDTTLTLSFTRIRT